MSIISPVLSAARKLVRLESSVERLTTISKEGSESQRQVPGLKLTTPPPFQVHKFSSGLSSGAMERLVFFSQEIGLSLTRYNWMAYQSYHSVILQAQLSLDRVMTSLPILHY
jgi:hypothetical protein